MNHNWPELPLKEWRETCDTLHLLTQIVGKIRLKLDPAEPEWGHAGLFISPNGITTGPIPYKDRLFEIEFDLVRHQINFFSSDKFEVAIPLLSMPIAKYHELIMKALLEMNIQVEIFTKPQEVPDPIPFEKDNVHHIYNPKYIERFWTILHQVWETLAEFRAPHRKRKTPVNFWWGTFDLSVSLFSGRPAVPPENSGLIMRGAMDAEFVEVGFWPGDDRFPEPAFYSFTYPQPENIEKSKIEPKEAYWDSRLREFILPYKLINKLPNPEEKILQFFQSTFSTGAKAANWNSENHYEKK